LLNTPKIHILLTKTVTNPMAELVEAVENLAVKEPVEVVEEPVAAKEESTGLGSWSAAELVTAICDALVAAGKIRSTPAFIRTDREAAIAKVFEKAKLDGAKLLSFSNAREVQVAIRKVTQGESWVDDVIDCAKTFLPAEVLMANTDMVESEESKKAKQAYKELCASRVEQGYGGQDDQPGDRRGGGGRSQQDNEAFASFGGRSGGGGGGSRACYNCGEEGHQVRSPISISFIDHL
jgi:uncharacterized membrane protein YgcG